MNSPTLMVIREWSISNYGPALVDDIGRRSISLMEPISTAVVSKNGDKSSELGIIMAGVMPFTSASP